MAKQVDQLEANLMALTTSSTSESQRLDVLSAEQSRLRQLQQDQSHSQVDTLQSQVEATLGNWKAPRISVLSEIDFGWDCLHVGLIYHGVGCFWCLPFPAF